MASKAAMKMTWKNMSQVMVDIFPDLLRPYEELLALWSRRSDDDEEDDFPGNHVIYGDVFTHYLVLLLRGEEEKHYLSSQFLPLNLVQEERMRKTKEGFDFLEGMCLNEDIRVQEVAVVTVLEYIYGRPDLLALAERHCGHASLVALRDLDDFWRRL